jgi:menaquinone reductase, molybdopterin-binding-like subunit
MERRNFIKISALTGVAATLDACRAPDKKLIRFIPEEDLIPGIATWKPSVCTLCSAGCGLQVRVMQGDAEVVRNGQLGVMKMGLAKKLEGSAQNPVNAGKLCARGHAGLQVLYHPDRITHPIKRTGARGSGEFQEITWDDALKELVAHLAALQAAKAETSLAFLARPLSGQRRTLIEQFLKAYGAPPAVWYEPFDEAVLRHANLLSFGHAALPTFELGRADYIISFGADFLGTWNSPVAQSAGYGKMRRGRAGRRGKFVQVESRMSQTGASADEWIACRPGTEGALALGIAHLILSQKLATQSAGARAGVQIAGWSAGLPDFTPEAVEKQTGVSAAVITRLAHEITQSGSSAAMVGGAPLAHTNGLFNALAVNALESLVDTGRDMGPILGFTPEPPLGDVGAPAAPTQSGFAQLTPLAQSALNGQAGAPQMLLLYEANPAFSAPAATRIREAIAKIPYIVSFGSFIDETSAQADLILPDHAPLESWLDSIPESGSFQSVVSVAPPAVSPLHDTRSMPDMLLGLAQQLGGAVAKALPWTTFDAMLKAALVPLRAHGGSMGSITASTDDDFWQSMQTQGGWWSTPAEAGSGSSAGKPSAAAAIKQSPMTPTAPEFAGSDEDFPFYFQPYVSQSLGDGSLANLPWMQELPDVLTTAMWSSWVEINHKTAERMGIQQGDLVEIASQVGSLRVPAILSRGIAPDMLSMPVGQGHDNFGRFATGHGANPLSILALLTEKQSGSLAWTATRVKLSRVGGPEQAKLILFAGGISGFPHEEESR